MLTFYAYIYKYYKHYLFYSFVILQHFILQHSTLLTDLSSVTSEDPTKTRLSSETIYCTISKNTVSLKMLFKLTKENFVHPEILALSTTPSSTAFQYVK